MGKLIYYIVNNVLRTKSTTFEAVCCAKSHEISEKMLMILLNHLGICYINDIN